MNFPKCPSISEQLEKSQKDQSQNQVNANSIEESEPKIGFYTKAERQLKIQKYREKIKRWLRGKNDKRTLKTKKSKQNDQKSCPYQNSQIGTEDLTSKLSSVQHSPSCAYDFLANFNCLPSDANLNDIVAQISGIN